MVEGKWYPQGADIAVPLRVRAATLEELMIFLEREGGAADDEKSVL